MKEKKVKLRMNQVNLNYRHDGEGKINLIFLHGWSIDSTYWRDQIDYFSDKYSVYAIDLPGFGDSTADNRTDWTIEEYALDVKDFIKTMELKNIILIGHSMSGSIALDVAIKSSDEIIGIIGVDNFKMIGDNAIAENREEVARFIIQLNNDYETAVTDYANNFLFMPSTPEDVRKRILKDYKKVDENTGIETFRASLEYAGMLRTNLQMLPHKLHLVNSDNYPTDEASLEEYCKNGFELRIISGTGHYPMVEKPQEFTRLLNDVVCKIATRFENEMTAIVSESIKAPVSVVWHALTDPDLISKVMFGARVESKWTEGSSIKWNGIWKGKYFEDKGMIVEMNRPYCLKYTHFSNLSGKPDEPENYHTVSYQLAQEGDHTLLLITQDNNDTESERDDSEKNWEQMVKELKKLVEA